jgi:hypothetical protein
MLCQNKCHIDRIIGILADNIQIILNHQTRPDQTMLMWCERQFIIKIYKLMVVAMNDVVCVMGAEFATFLSSATTTLFSPVSIAALCITDC